MNRKKLWWLPLPIGGMVLLFIFTAYINYIYTPIYHEEPQTEDLSISKYSDITGKYYEENSTGYKAAFYEKNEIGIEKIENWLTACETAEGYYQYIYSDPDSWDMFIYYSPENASFCAYDFKFSVDASVVNVYVSNDNSADFSADYILIRIQAPKRGVWPNSSELYVNGSLIKRQDSKFTV